MATDVQELLTRAINAAGLDVRADGSDAEIAEMLMNTQQMQEILQRIDACDRGLEAKWRIRLNDGTAAPRLFDTPREAEKHVELAWEVMGDIPVDSPWSQPVIEYNPQPRVGVQS